jgi:hypothetical protein
MATPHRSPRITGILLALVGVLLAIGSVAYFFVGQAIADPGVVSLPKSLAGLSLSSATYGLEAVAEINRLHSQEFPLTSGAMGMYGDSEATVWVTGLPITAMAAQMVSAMRDKIAASNSPFTPTGEQAQGSRSIYTLDGLGQKHFYFQSGDRVIWLAVDPALAPQILQQTLEFYP